MKRQFFASALLLSTINLMADVGITTDDGAPLFGYFDTTTNNPVVDCKPGNCAPRPIFVAMTTDGKKAVITSPRGQVTFVDVPHQTVYHRTTTLPASTAPWDVAITPDNKIAYVVDERSNLVYALSMTNGAILPGSIGHPNPLPLPVAPSTPSGASHLFAIAITPNTPPSQVSPRVYVSEALGNQVFIFNSDLTVPADINTLTVGSLSSAFEDIAITLPPTIAGQKQAAILTDTNGEQVFFIDVATETLLAPTTGFPLAGIDPDPLGVIALSVFPSGPNLAYVANTGNHSVEVIDLSTFPPSFFEVIPFPPSSFPLFLAATSDGTKVYVTDPFNRVLRIIVNANHSIFSPTPPLLSPQTVAVPDFLPIDIAIGPGRFTPSPPPSPVTSSFSVHGNRQ